MEIKKKYWSEEAGKEIIPGKWNSMCRKAEMRGHGAF